MSLINQYETLKTTGSWRDQVKYVLSLSDKTEIEQHLKKSAVTIYNDLRMLVCLSASTKNEKNLLEIFSNQSYPVEQRTHAGKIWLKLQKDQQKISDFIIQTINDKTVPRLIKNRILKGLHRIDCLKKSPTFFYDLLCRLTEVNYHSQYNIDAHLLPFCSVQKNFELLSRWSIKNLTEIDRKSALYARLLSCQPLVIIQLIKNDFDEKKKDKEAYKSYFRENQELMKSLYRVQPKEFLNLTIEYIKNLDKHQKFLPSVIEHNLAYFFKVAPNETIELITMVAANKPGSIKTQSAWYSTTNDLDWFAFPGSFSVENYLRLFSALYDTCKWSANNTICLLQMMLQCQSSQKSLGALNKQRKWLIDVVINQRIGKEAFLKKLCKEGDQSTLDLLERYSELTTPLSVQLLSQAERKGIVDAKERLSFLRYQTMTQTIFDEFLSLFKKTGSDVIQRAKNYQLFLKCALSTNEQFVEKVLQWIAKRFTNEQLIVLENFVDQLYALDDRFQFEILPNNFESVQTILSLTQNHLQRTENTSKIIMKYATRILKRAEIHANKERKAKVQTFATQMMKECFSIHQNNCLPYTDDLPISQAYPETRQIFADIFVNDVLPNLVSKRHFDSIQSTLDSVIEKSWLMPQIDAFVNKFFTETLPSSAQLQSAFRINSYNSIVDFYLKNPSTRSERVNQLLKLDTLFFLEKSVQQNILRSQQHRQMIDQLIEDEKCITSEKLSNSESKFTDTNDRRDKDVKLPGFEISLLSSCSHLLTGQQQERITNIILNDFLQYKDVNVAEKMSALHVLRRFPHTYQRTLEWIQAKEDSQLITNSTNTTNRPGRGITNEALGDIVKCLPTTFDLPPEQIFKYFDFLKTKLNASNAKYISDAMLCVSRRIPEDIFLEQYLQFIQDEQFPKYGITANKEILRLLTEFISKSDLVHLIIQPFWEKHPHQDIRVCLISTLLHFIGRSKEQTVIWQILQQATNDEYLPVIQSLFVTGQDTSNSPLSQIKASQKDVFKAFVNQIQFAILDHPSSLEARSTAWLNIDQEYSDIQKLADKAEIICTQFDKEGNTLCSTAFETILSCYKHQIDHSLERIIEIIKKVMARRDEIDSKENAIDNRHDLPVYHRVQSLL
ncbi:unnamed protein product, partial [Adineta ricciae]